LAENFPLLKQYRSMFHENDHMKKILVWMYEDILKFHLRALRVFTQPGAPSDLFINSSLMIDSLAAILQRNLERLSRKFQANFERYHTPPRAD
jgi:hypothetical protein